MGLTRKFVLFSRILERMTRPVKQFILLCVDVVLAPLTLVMTLVITAPRLFGSMSATPFLTFLGTATLATLCLSLLFGIPRIKLKSYETIGAFKSSLVGLGATVALAIVGRATGQQLPPVTLFVFALCFTVSMIVIRYVMLHLLLAVLRVGHQRRNVLIYGAGKTGTQLASALRGHESVRVVAFIDDNASLHGMSIMGLTVHGPGALDRLVLKHDVERVLLAMPSASLGRQNRIARDLTEKGLEVQSVPSFAQLVGAEVIAESLIPVSPVSLMNRSSVEDLDLAVNSTYRSKCILVSGAGGSVGSELCRQLLPYQPQRVILFEVSELALYTIHRELIALPEASGIEFIPILGSVTEYRQVRAVCAQHGVDVILHAAAYKHVPLVEANPLAGVVNNILGTRTMAEAAMHTGVKRFVLISTDKAVRPTNVMGSTKRMAELIVQDLAKRSDETEFLIVRFGNVLGSSGSVVPLFREQIARGGPVTLTHEDVTRYFMTISEAARLVLIAGGMTAANERVSGDLLVLDMGKPMRIRELAERMIAAAGCTVRNEDNPDGDIEIVVTGLRPGEKLHEELLIEPGMLTTPHEKILRARERTLTELEVATALRDLRSAVATGDVESALAVMETHVEGYDQKRAALGATS